jgi:predicted DNA-binding ribbon-helix-helix protein
MPRPVKRSFKIAGHRTSISLEAPFWNALRQAAEVERTTVAALVASIDKGRGASGLSSAVRVWVLDFFRSPRADSSVDTETGQRTTLG